MTNQAFEDSPSLMFGMPNIYHSQGEPTHAGAGFPGRARVRSNIAVSTVIAVMTAMTVL
ncbi:hypothetical protein [Nocardiopsis sp. JB363]|uniref:hypothetical protein n=1 Tax=Nocardiopsis sp. JB363 TaxID=1434837 RepID=UPI00190E9D3E|nr:hypothetical protein [Nocardiopsis sp. JB363]